LDRLNDVAFPVALAAWLHGSVDDAGARAIAKRLRLSNKESDRTAWLLRELPAMADAATMRWPRLQRLLSHEGGASLVELAAATLPAGDAGVARCRAALARPGESWNPPPLVTGDDLIAHGLKAGRHFADLLEHLRDEQLEGRIVTAEAALAEAERWIAARG
jgi:poly(A) polymerase